VVFVRLGSPDNVDAMVWATSHSRRDQWRAAATLPDSLLLVAEESGHVRGKAVLDFNLRRDAAWLWLVSVDPAPRGRGWVPH
jgi:hypothetical protein